MKWFGRKVVGDDGKELKQAHLGGNEPQMYYCKEKKRWRQKRAPGEESSEEEQPLAPPPMAPIKRATEEDKSATPQWNPHAQLRKKQQAKKKAAQANVTTFNPAGPFGAGGRPPVEAVVAATNPFAPKVLVASQGGAEVAATLPDDVKPLSFEDRFRVTAPEQTVEEKADISDEKTSDKPFAADRFDNPAPDDMVFEACDENMQDTSEAAQQGIVPVDMTREAYDENFHKFPETTQSDDALLAMEREVNDENVHEVFDTAPQEYSGVDTERDVFDDNFHEPPEATQQEQGFVDTESELFDENFNEPSDALQHDNAPVNTESAKDAEDADDLEVIEPDARDMVEPDSDPFAAEGKWYNENLELHDSGVMEPGTEPADENSDELDDVEVVQLNAGPLCTESGPFPAKLEKEAEEKCIEERPETVEDDKSPVYVESDVLDDNIESHELAVVEPDVYPERTLSPAYEKKEPPNDGIVQFDTGFSLTASSERHGTMQTEIISREDPREHVGDFITCVSKSVKGSESLAAMRAEDVEQLMRDHATMLTRALEAERLLAAERAKNIELEKKIQALTGESQNASTTIAHSEFSVDSQMTRDQCTELVNTLAHNESNQFLVKAACQQLERVTTFDNRESLVHSGGVDAIFSVMEKYDENAEVVLPVANALWNLTFCDEALEAVAKSAKMSLILNILDYHAEPKIAIACCGAIMNLCSSPENRKELFTHDGIASLVRATEKHSDTANVVENACQALYIAALHSKNRVVDAGGRRVSEIASKHASRSVTKWGKWLQEIIQ